jgi:hypothetical protein
MQKWARVEFLLTIVIKTRKKKRKIVITALTATTPKGGNFPRVSVGFRYF